MPALSPEEIALRGEKIYQDLRAHHPQALLYGLRIGYPALSKRGGTWALSFPER